MRSYSAIITCSIVASLAPVGVLIPIWYKFYNKIRIKCYFVKLQNHFSQDLLFVGCDIFLKLWLSFCTLLNMFLLGFNTLVALPVCILRAKLYKIVIKSQIVMFWTFVLFWKKTTYLRLWYFISTYSDLINLLFAVVV